MDGYRWDDRSGALPRPRLDPKPIRLARERLEQLARIIRHRHGHSIPAHEWERRWEYALVAADAFARTRRGELAAALEGWWAVWCDGEAIPTAVLGDVLARTDTRRTWIADRHDAAGWIDLAAAEWDAIGGLSRFGVCDLEPTAFAAFRRERGKRMARERAARSRARRRAPTRATAAPTNAELAARYGVTDRTIKRWRREAKDAGTTVERIAAGKPKRRGRPTKQPARPRPENVTPPKMSPVACALGKMSPPACALGAPPTGGRLPARTPQCVTPPPEVRS